MPIRLTRLLNQYFYFFMSLLIAVVIVYGFSQTINQHLVHPPIAPPAILYPHAAVFSAWVLFLILQSALVRTHNVRIHRTLGWFGVAIGCAMPILGVSTAITMDRFRIVNFHTAGVTPFLAVQFCDMICFTIPFALAILWRRKPEFHRRLILVASCALTAAAFGRFPFEAFRDNWFYTGVDLLLLLGIIRDLVVNRTIHPVYRYALPALMFTESHAMYLFLAAPKPWMNIATAILR